MHVCMAIRPGLDPVYSYFKKGGRKKCTRQSRKVLWVILSSLFFKKISKNGTKNHGTMFAMLKESDKVDSTATVSGKVYDHIPYYLSGLSRAQFFRQPFSK